MKIHFLLLVTFLSAGVAAYAQAPYSEKTIIIEQKGGWMTDKKYSNTIVVWCEKCDDKITRFAGTIRQINGTCGCLQITPATSFTYDRSKFQKTKNDVSGVFSVGLNLESGPHSYELEVKGEIVTDNKTFSITKKFTISSNYVAPNANMVELR